MLKSNLLTIKEFSEIARISPRMLRFWESMGIFRPAKVDNANKYRYYDPLQVKQVLQIKLLTNFHIPLKNIKSTLGIHNPEVILQSRLDSLDSEIIEKQKEHKFLKQIHELFFDDNYLQKNLKTDYLGPFTLFCTKVDHGKYHKINSYIEDLWRIALELKLECKPSEITFYLDEPYIYDPKDAKLEIALICKSKDIPKEVSIPQRYYFKKYPQTQMMILDYIGPYEYMALIDERIKLYFKEHKIKVKTGELEKYIKGPFNIKSKYDYSTLLGYPV